MNIACDWLYISILSKAMLAKGLAVSLRKKLALRSLTVIIVLSTKICYNQQAGLTMTGGKG